MEVEEIHEGHISYESARLPSNRTGTHFDGTQVDDSGVVSPNSGFQLNLSEWTGEEAVPSPAPTPSASATYESYS
jgi:hypothetical protein